MARRILPPEAFDDPVVETQNHPMRSLQTFQLALPAAEFEHLFGRFGRRKFIFVRVEGKAHVSFLHSRIRGQSANAAPAGPAPGYTPRRGRPRKPRPHPQPGSTTG